MEWTLFWQLFILACLLAVLIQSIVGSCIEKHHTMRSFTEMSRDRNWANLDK